MSRFFCILAIVLVSFKAKAQDFFFPQKMTQTEILTNLFEGKWDAALEKCFWKPNLWEKFNFGVSYNGMLYSEVDTAFSFTTVNGRHLIMIVATYVMEEDGRLESGFCSAPSMSIIELYFDEKRKGYTLLLFKKFVAQYGFYGELSPVSLLYVGGDIHCIRVEGGYWGQGYEDSFSVLYYMGEKIFSFSTRRNNSGTADPEYSNVTTLLYDKETNKLILKTKGTDIIGDDATKIVIVDQIETYEFKGGQFVKICD